jgi:hypothetical protein
MGVRWVLVLFFFTALGSAFAQESGGYSVEIDLQDQLAYLIRNGRMVLTTPISTGRAGHYTTRGEFKIMEKELNHRSSMYGKIVNGRGATLVADADSDMPLSPGGRFVAAPMRYFMRFHGAEGMHAGYLPGYAASHGCVRMPEKNAIAFFEAVQVGTPVTVFGSTARGLSRANNYPTQRRRPAQITRRVGPRYPAPAMWWR